MTDRAITEHVSATIGRPALEQIAALVSLDRPFEVLDIGASPLVGESPCYTPLVEASLARVTGFEPDPEALAVLQARDAEGRSRHLGAAVGDGQRHRLHTCRAGGFSSLLTPDPDQLAVLTDFLRLAEVTGHTEVDTVRLDDVPDLGVVDLVALDVQGSETAVIDGGPRVFAGVFAVQVEVGFHRLYVDGPTFADVDARLRACGLVPHMVVTSRTWPLAPVGWHDPLEAHSRHLVEADMLYVRDPARLDAVDEESLRAGALVAAGAYGSVGMALLCVRELVRRGALSAGAEAEFRRIVSAALDLPTPQGTARHDLPRDEGERG